ncbi:phospholipid phosphatase 3-like isoform X1 [Sebastes umbrosus]|uniref:phospholipid phosphatase 3-like isoform X1 n=1 Tax=Sebastes umbrosus TaxID=72105 RepID=UPI0018A01AA4|nr:phospholipid phosphatase 3-like isoform X1 [Sebastes umbrosus]XP_037621836.1 phospholipid phosphatase 3-like isoform X1 [Sebastes umbrosus]
MLERLGPQSSVSSPDLQLKLTDNKSSLSAAAAAAGMGMEKKLIEITGPALSKRKLLVGLDLLCLFLASIPFFACELKAVSPYRRGFMCGDPSITYPYLHREAIPDELLITGGIIITGLTIALGECYRVRFRGVSSKAFVRNLYVSSLYKELGCFLFGCCVGQSLTNMAKLSVGRLRPHFLSVCGVTYASLNCTPGTYVATVNCRQPDHRLEEEARKSFFSGHASFAMYTMLYLAFYLQARLTWRGARLLRPALQFFLVLLAVYTGLTRISDYRHHPSDVLTGYIQGALTAYWVAFHISSMFKSSISDLSPTETLDSPLSPHHTVC